MPPTIETERLTLRPFQLDDAQALHAAVYGDEEAMRYLPGGIPRTLQQTERVIEYYQDHWAQNGLGVWAVIHRADNKLIGQAGLNFVPETQQTEVLFAIGQEYWGRGLAREAAGAACRYAFYSKGETKLIALVAPENTRSLKVIEKLGFEYRRNIEVWKMKVQMHVVVPSTLRVGKAAYRQINAND